MALEASSSSNQAGTRGVWFLVGLFLTTLSTLTLETLDTRLLSVLTWYHLSFFAVSVAMLGMAAGAVNVYLRGDRFSGESAGRALGRYSTAFAISIPISHLFNVSIPILNEITVNGIVSLLLSTVVVAVPFYLSGIVVTIALTRIPGKIGLVYGVDLLGASLGSLLVLVLLNTGSITTAVFGTSVLAALGALSFRLYAEPKKAPWLLYLALVMGVATAANAVSHKRVRILFAKGGFQPTAAIDREYWSIHGQVITHHMQGGAPVFWGPGNGAERFFVHSIFTTVDGGAATYVTKWDARNETLDWIPYDLTALPYHIRRGGDTAVIGVGGGRDVLGALWGESKSVTGVEINHAFLKLHTGAYRSFSRLVDRPEVKLVHDEARSYLTRTPDRFDVIQMSLIDTWAATGAGAFTLSENGLYTVEAWKVFLGRLKPRGVYSVSRWYTESNASETSRLVALATAALLRVGVEEPRENLVIYSRGHLATLLASNQPFSASDLAKLRGVAARWGFRPLLIPGEKPVAQLLGRIADSRSEAEIDDVVRNEPYDYTPPTDERPYFFNLIKPSKPVVARTGLDDQPGVVGGNLLATATLGVLFLVVLVLLVGVVFGPLARSGLPRLSRADFGFSVLYFGLIGTGFMLIQIGLMQRFSVYLGHPTYSVAVVLFSMILATGIGSLISDRLPIETRVRWCIALPIAAAITTLIVTLLLEPLIASTIEFGLFVRCVLTVLLVAPLSAILGMFFPMGMRLVHRLSDDAMPWMWGVNGAAGVLASVVAVAISMWAGIHTNLYTALLAYALLALPAAFLWRHGRTNERESRPPSMSDGDALATGSA